MTTCSTVELGSTPSVDDDDDDDDDDGNVVMMNNHDDDKGLNSREEDWGSAYYASLGDQHAQVRLILP